MQISTVTQKGQTTIPIEIRQKLDIHSGDKVGFECIGNKIYIKKISPLDYAYHKALEGTLTEWSSAEDDDAFKDL